NGRIPQQEFDKVGLALGQLVVLSEALNQGELATLIHTMWRHDLAVCVVQLHGAVDNLTTATLAWLGTEVAFRLRQIAVSIASEPDCELTAEQALEGWPTLPKLDVVSTTNG